MRFLFLSFAFCQAVFAQGSGLSVPASAGDVLVGYLADSFPIVLMVVVALMGVKLVVNLLKAAGWIASDSYSSFKSRSRALADSDVGEYTVLDNVSPLDAEYTVVGGSSGSSGSGSSVGPARLEGSDVSGSYSDGGR